MNRDRTEPTVASYPASVDYQKYDHYYYVLFYKVKLQNKQSDHAYQYSKIIANGIELCAHYAGDFIFTGKVAVN